MTSRRADVSTTKQVVMVKLGIIKAIRYEKKCGKGRFQRKRRALFKNGGPSHILPGDMHHTAAFDQENPHLEE